MTKREFASLVLKLLGIYTIVQSLPALQYFAVPALEHGEPALRMIVMTLMMAVPFILLMTAGIVLIACSNKLAGFLIKDDNQMSLPAQMSGAEFQAICFAAVAVLVFLSGVPRIISFISNLWVTIKSPAPDSYAQARFVRNAWQSGIAALIQCGLALILFFRAKGLANFWHRIQTERYVKIQDSESKQ